MQQFTGDATYSLQRDLETQAAVIGLSVLCEPEYVFYRTLISSIVLPQITVGKERVPLTS